MSIKKIEQLIDEHYPSMRKRILTKKGNVAEGNFNINTPEAKEAIESVIDAGTEYLRNKLNHQKEEK